MCRSAAQLCDAVFWCWLLFQKRQNFLNQRIGRDAMLLSQERNRSVLDEFVRPTNPRNRCVDLPRMEMFHYRATESVMQHVVFDGGDDFHAAREKLERAGIHWLDPARINQRH